MTAPWMFRSLAVALFAVCVGLAALPGCNGPAPKPDKKEEKKDEPKSGEAPVTPGAGTPGTGTPDAPAPKSTLGPIEPEADQFATAFRRDVVMGTAKADALSAAFLKAVGKPLVFQSDKDKGVSTGSAESWLRKVGEGVNFGLETKRPDQAGAVVYLRGALQKPGGYCLRLVKEGGAWKVDWLSVSAVEGTVTAPPTPEGAAQGFAVAAFVETVAGMPDEVRAAPLAAAVTPALRAAWAPPFEQDRSAGYDYNPAALVRKATNEIGGGTTAYTAARVGDLPEFKVELTKPAGKKTFVVKLVKGTGPSEWLVSEVTEAKGG